MVAVGYNRRPTPRWISFGLMPLVAGFWLFAPYFTPKNSEALRNRNIVLLIAHPDDEAMFFAPTLQALTNPKLENNVQIVCFSIGDAEGIGETRRAELLESAELLGIPAVNSSVNVHDHPALPDSMSKKWSEDLVASLMSNSIHGFNKDSTKPVDTLITFDKGGISNHPNHISLLHGARYFIKNYPNQKDILLYTLITVPIYRKYISILDAFITAAYSKNKKDDTQSLMFLSNWDEYRNAQIAMTDGHKSQMVWFRWGWITLSRYMVFNNLELDHE